MRTQRLIKSFSFSDDDAITTTLGPSVRIDPRRHRAVLDDAGTGVFPTAVDLYLRTRLTNPSTVRQWLGFEATAVQYLGDTDQVVTSVGFRLSDGTADFYWSGSAWVTPASGQWNTEQQVADHIATFSAARRALAIVANLRTTDARVSPELIELKVLWSSDIDSFEEDIILRSLLPYLKQVRPVAQFLYKNASSSPISAFTVAAAKLEEGYDVTGIDSVFDHTNDPTHRTDIFASFVSTGSVETENLVQTINLSRPLAAGAQVWVRFLFQPEAALTTSQDYSEQQKLPALVVSQVQLVNSAVAQSGEQSVANKGAGTGVRVLAPLQGDLAFRLRIMADKATDRLRIEGALNALFDSQPRLRSTGLDELYRVWPIDRFEQAGEPSQEEILESEAGLRICNVRFWLKGSRDEAIAKRVVLNLSGEAAPLAITGAAGVPRPLP